MIIVTSDVVFFLAHTSSSALVSNTKKSLFLSKKSFISPVEILDSPRVDLVSALATLSHFLNVSQFLLQRTVLSNVIFFL